MTNDPSGTVTMALAHAARLLPVKPALAAAQAREILKAVPNHPQAQLLLGAALRAAGDAGAAKAVLEPLAAEQAKSADVAFELGLALGELGESKPAIAALSRVVKLNPGHAHAWRALGDELSAAGDGVEADKAYARHIKASVNDPKLMEAAAALCDNRLAVAERLLRDFLKEQPTDVAAIRMLAETGTRLGRYEDAENLLARCLELAPSFMAARYNYAAVLYRQNKPTQAIAEIDKLLTLEPRNPAYRAMKAAALGQIGEYQQAIRIYESLLKGYPDQPKVWMSYGHTLKALGRQEDGIDAYRRSIALLPSLGEAYWSLANLKTFRFTGAEIDAMRVQLARTDLADEDRYHFDFALGKALEDAGEYAGSFAHYEQGNALRRKSAPYDIDEFVTHVERMKTLFTADFLKAREGFGSPAHDPIFVIGLPRAGSTLIEQILSSHSAVEGTMELPDIISIAKRLGGRKRKDDDNLYPAILETLDREEFRALGEEYLSRTCIQRKLGRSFFIDKMPNNFIHIGFIHLILPNAKIIDARRHPLGCCFSCFKQHFARGQAFTYSFTDLGRYYSGYADLMTHFDRVLPGRVHRMLYEEMVAEPEREVRKLLDYCGLPFEEGCLRFYENERAVRTASSEQVRRPIFTEGLDQWRNYEPWLGPLKEALGPVL